MAIDRSIKLTTLPRPPGPTASENERTAWSVRVYRAITEITRAIQNIEGNQGALIAPALGGGGDPLTAPLSNDNPEDVANTPSPGTGIEYTRQDHVHKLGTAGNQNYLRRDGTNAPTAEMDWDGKTIKDLSGVTVNGVPILTIQSEGITIGATGTVAILDTPDGKDLRLNPGGANIVNGQMFYLRRRNTVNPASGQRLARFQENVFGPGFIDRFSIWSDDTFGEGGIGIPNDQKMSYDDLSSLRGDTFHRYNSTLNQLELFVDGTKVYEAKANGDFRVPNGLNLTLDSGFADDGGSASIGFDGGVA